MRLALLHFSVRKVFSHRDPGRQRHCRNCGPRTVLKERTELSAGAQTRDSHSAVCGGVAQLRLPSGEWVLCTCFP